ncbi:hypothetical protein M404DRAFT_390556 [Pisolithus tinctorius Marx 270]|uniref:Uncharacterized protein n=1 Tax=Pisolithus tinctorius Marx 270 TaxID=870435 RepID=A0A0C3PGU5_PISTI|nr:hypothetical protein M404DRAFT_390556 [Pisolithus tinctorius Marx 270]
MSSSRRRPITTSRHLSQPRPRIVSIVLSMLDWIVSEQGLSCKSRKVESMKI